MDLQASQYVDKLRLGNFQLLSEHEPFKRGKRKRGERERERDEIELERADCSINKLPTVEQNTPANRFPIASVNITEQN